MDKCGKKYLVHGTFVIVAITLVVRIIMYTKNRSLWLDEALLAENVVSRNWAQLLASPLSNGQSAPVLYIVAAKIISSVFGYSEFSLRFFSLLSFLALLICLVIFLRKALRYDNARIAFVLVMCSMLPMYIWYSNEFKPYMSDALFAVLTLMSYFYYNQNKIRLPVLTVLFIVFLGFSSPAIFFIGGTMLYEFINTILKKDKNQIFYVALSGIIIVLIFILYYLWWMAPVSEYMKQYWDEAHNRGGTIRQILRIFTAAGNSNSLFIWSFVPFALLGFYSLVKSKSITACSASISLFLAFFASAIGKWPLTGRLWLFLPVIILIFTPSGFDEIISWTKYKKTSINIGLCVFWGMMVLLTKNSLSYTGDKTFFSAYEANPLIDYVQKNIMEDEVLYVYWGKVDVVRFRIGYDTSKIGDVAEDNIIFGKSSEEWLNNTLGNELLSVIEHDKVYILFRGARGRNYKGLDVLQNYGTLTQVMNVYDTPLYYFEKIK